MFDSRLTTYAGLARLDDLGVRFITLRRRSPKILDEIRQLPPSAWRRVTLDVSARKYRTPRVWEKTVQLFGHPFRQIYVLDLGHEDPTVLLTNEQRTPPKLLTRYAQRILIENAISDAVRFFHMDALSSAVGLKVDFDMALLVIASGLYRRLLAPPSKTVDGLLSVPIDIESINAVFTFDGAAQTATADATITYTVGPTVGNPIVDLRQNITQAWLDGALFPVAQLAHHDFGVGAFTDLRVIESVQATGSVHTLRVQYDLSVPDSQLGGSYLRLSTGFPARS